MLPTEGRAARFTGRLGAELDGLAVAREYLGSLHKIKRIVRLGVSVATSGDVREHPKVADGPRSCCKMSLEEKRTPVA
jgi:hypothetical protein